MSANDPSLLATVHDDTLGRLIDGRYRVKRVLGEGGLGRVYAAKDERLGREVALKVLLAEHAQTPSLRARFEREAKALSALSHPNIVTITDFGLDGERAFVVMELLHGQDLASLLSHTRLEVPRAIAILRGVLSALAYAHAQQIVHRDLKPSNVMIRPLPDGSEHVAVLDFGLAKFLDEPDESPQQLTRAGAMLGTPAYMSPEQACGVPADARSDVFSAGLILYELLVGSRPFAESSGPELLRRRLVEAPPPLASVAPHLGPQPELQSVLNRALAGSVDARFADAREMLHALDALPVALTRVSAPPLTPGAGAPAALTPPTMMTVASARPGAGAPVQAQASQVAQPSQASFASHPSQPGYGAPGYDLSSASAPGYPSPSDPSFAPDSASQGGLPSGSDPAARTHLALGVGLVAVFGLGFVVVVLVALFFLSRTSGDENASAPPPAIPATAGATAPSAPPPAPANARVPARDPWRSPPALEDPVASVYARLNRGGTPSRDALRGVATYAANHRNDPRPRLLLARAYGAQNWLGDALPHLQAALEIDPSVRGDPHVMPVLVRLLFSAQYHAPAAAIIREYFGAEARPALEAALAERRRPSDEDARVRALIATL